MQSTNEELETAKEELQSVNEELTTVNEEVQTRNNALSLLNNDLNYFLNSVNVPVVMLELDLRIRRFTSMAERIFNLVPTDIGRRFGDIKPKVHIPHLDRHITKVINTMAVHEQEVVDDEGRYYQLSIRPYRNPENKIDGAVLVFVDIDSIKRASLIKEQIVDISSREQQRIAHDLHDSLGQELAAITYRVRALKSRLSVAKSAEAEEAGKIGVLTETALARTRDLAKFIQPVELGTRGLIQSLKDLAQSSSRLYAIDCTFTCPRPVQFTSQDAALHVFRIAQQAVHNAVKHGKPLIAIFLDIKPNSLNGVKLLRKIKSRSALHEIPIVVMTSSNDPKDIEECSRLGMHGYITKPVTYMAFANAVADLFLAPSSRKYTRIRSPIGLQGVRATPRTLQ